MNRERWTGRTVRAKSERGFTLIELIVVMVLIAIVAVVVARLLVSGVDTYTFVSSRKEALQSARLALQRMTREIRLVKSPSSIYQASTDSLRFQDINDSSISFQFQGTTLYRNSDVLAANVDDVTFGYHQADGSVLSTPVTNPSLIWKITLSMRLTVNGQSVTLSSEVVPRNF